MPKQPNIHSVARDIAKGERPGWLVLGLEQFSDFVGGRPTTPRFPVAHVHDAAATLIKFLPVYLHLPAGGKLTGHSHADVVTTLKVLQTIKAELGRLIRRQRGRPKNVRYEVCAAVVVEAWKLIHESVNPESPDVLTACNDYWFAYCGEYRGNDILNWVRDTRLVAAKPHDWIKQALTTLSSVHN
jgi:hypothetical protein